jgi:hypothetical protein
MRHAMTTWKIAEYSDEHTAALEAWRRHCDEAHPQIRAIRCYMFNGGTEYVWLEEFEDYRSFQELQESVDDRCSAVMKPVMEHAVPGSLRTGFWVDAI